MAETSNRIDPFESMLNKAEERERETQRMLRGAVQELDAGVKCGGVLHMWIVRLCELHQVEPPKRD